MESHNILLSAQVDFSEFTKGQINDNSYYWGFDSSNNNVLTRIDSNLNKDVIGFFPTITTTGISGAGSSVVLTTFTSESLVRFNYKAIRGTGLATGTIEIVKNIAGSGAYLNEELRTVYAGESLVDTSALVFTASIVNGKLVVTATLNAGTDDLSLSIFNIIKL
ncbi:MAG: hypothetical protein M0P71_14735 [Melioribacteraceae bacterium]|nr:hypothetical protein [Melioribacteraceae bacterium]